jgi:hypothetical protein
VRRALLALAAALAATGCGSSKPEAGPTTTAAASTASAGEQPVCPTEQKAGITADFGKRRSQAAADELRARAEQVGFQGLAVQRRGCDDYAVVLLGLRTLKQALAFQREAESAGFPVAIECRSHPVEGGLAAVFGHRRTQRDAQELLAQAERLGFRGLRVQQDKCGDWEVDLYGLSSPGQRRTFAAEARKAGLHVRFELG